jgi:trafficking protein particle complex subunit 10
VEKHVLKPGKNVITLDLPPQKPGSYVLGALTGQIGHLQFRSHSFSKAGPVDSDDFMSYEKPIRPVLKVIFDLAYILINGFHNSQEEWNRECVSKEIEH